MIELSADQHELQELARALKSEADGSKLRRDLAKNLRQALEPAKEHVKAALLSMGTAGLDTVATPRLRATVIRQLKAEARLTGRTTGARLRIKKKGMPRGFDNAPKRLNSAKGWRHPVPRVRRRDGSSTDVVWVEQKGAPGYFDDTTKQHRSEYRAAVKAAMDAAAERIDRKV